MIKKIAMIIILDHAYFPLGVEHQLLGQLAISPCSANYIAMFYWPTLENYS
jgi:hypothetical protein